MARAKLFMNGGSQAVRLPKEFRFEGEEVEIRKVGESVVISPARTDLDEWFRSMDLADDDFMAEGRNQPLTTPEKIFD
jgi:antitoxin VapB